MRRAPPLLGILLGLSGSAAAPFCPPNPQNAALGRPYDLLPHPNYDHPSSAINNQVGDATDLTDGCFVQASHASEASVTWAYWPKVGVDIALDAPGCAGDALACEPIAEIRFHVQDQKGGAGVLCPKEATFLVSDDGMAYHPVAVWLRPAGYPGVDCGPPGPQFGGFNFRISSGTLATRGAFAKVVIAADPPYVFIDEVEVLRGVDPTETNYLDDDFYAGLDALGPDWRVFAEDPWEVTGPKTLPPPGASDAAVVSLALARGEVGSAALMITNPHAVPFQLMAAASALTGPEGAVLPPSTVEFRQAATAPTLMFDERADALFPAATQGVTAPARETSHVWIDVTAPADAVAGSYAGSVTLSCQGGGCTGSKLIALELLVQPFTLPDGGDSRATYFDWSYSVPEAEAYQPGIGADERAALRERYAMSGEVSYLTPLPPFQSGHPRPPDFTQLGLDLARHDFATVHLLYLAGGDNWYRNFLGHVCYPSAAWNATYAYWIGKIRDSMLGHGLDYDSFAIYPIDEPVVGAALGAGAGCPAPGRDRMDFYRDAATIIHAVDPELRIFIDTYEKSVAVLQQLATSSLADVWVPTLEDYFGDPALALFYQSRVAAGDTVWLYNAPVLSHAHGRPYEDARLVPWAVFDAGLHGYGYWALFDPARAVDDPSEAVSVWRPLDGVRPPYCTIYLSQTWDPETPAGLPTDEGAIPSRRLAALRRGIEDVRALELLRELIDVRAGLADCADEVAAGTSVLAAAAPTVLADPADHARADLWTDQVDSAILTLIPAEEPHLVASKVSVPRLGWSDRGPGVVYDIVGGRLTALSSDGSTAGALCLASDVAEPTWDDPRPDPPAGDGDYYLVRTQNGCLAGTYGASSAGSEHLPALGCP